jgi:8-oxo-dGTP diphosphatase
MARLKAHCAHAAPRKVGVIVLIRDAAGRFLIGRRSPEEPSSPGYWLPVAGTVERGESEEAAVVREALEESGLEVAPVQRVASHDTTDGVYRLHYWRVTLQGGQLRLSPEHAELGWFTLEEALRLAPMHPETRAVLSAEQLAAPV